MNQYYFNLIPRELNYKILNLLDYTSFKNSNDVIFNLEKVNYEILFKYRYNDLYFYVNDIIKDFIRRSGFDRLYIFCVVYKYILISNVNESIHHHIKCYRNPLNVITNYILDFIELKIKYPIFYQKLDWFPLYPNTIYLITKSMDTIKTAIDLDEEVSMDILNFNDYIDTGKIKDKIVFNLNVRSNIITLEAILILTYIMIKEYLECNSRIIFGSSCIGLNPDHLINIFKDDQNQENYNIYIKHIEFFEFIIKFIKDNKHKLKYI